MRCLRKRLRRQYWFKCQPRLDVSSLRNRQVAVEEAVDPTVTGTIFWSTASPPRSRMDFRYWRSVVPPDGQAAACQRLRELHRQATESFKCSFKQAERPSGYGQGNNRWACGSALLPTASADVVAKSSVLALPLPASDGGPAS